MTKRFANSGCSRDICSSRALFACSITPLDTITPLRAGQGRASRTCCSVVPCKETDPTREGGCKLGGVFSVSQTTIEL